MKTLLTNKMARRDYFVKETLEAGIVLRGYEVKAIRQGRGSLRGSYVTFRQLKDDKIEANLLNAHIDLYEKAGQFVDSYEPKRTRKLLIKRKECESLCAKAKSQGLTIIPLKLYTSKGLVKLQIALAKGKKEYDKREDIKKKQSDRDMARSLKR